MTLRAYPSGFELFKHHANDKQVIKDYITDNLPVYWQPKESRLNVLDIGCGMGEVTSVLLDSLNLPPKQVDVTLVEPLQQALEIAQARLHQYEPRSYRGTYEEFCLDPANTQQYDLILNCHTIYYTGFESLPRMFASINPAGLLLVVVSGKESFFRSIAEVFPFAQQVNGQMVYESMQLLPTTNLVYELKDISLSIDYALNAAGELTEQGKDLASFLLLKEYDEYTSVEKEAVYELYRSHQAAGQLTSTNDFIWAFN